MQANPSFLHRSSQFWGYVRIISEKVGYSQRGENCVKTIRREETLEKLSSIDVSIEEDMLKDVLEYLDYRTNILNNNVQHNLMNAAEAKIIFEQLQKIHTSNAYLCKLPFNKQKAEKYDYSYFTGIINILTEQHLKEYAEKNDLKYGTDIMFDDDPSVLTYVKDSENQVQGALSRRFDGAYPSTINPKAIWEIKEYYYTTTFGSRISDGVFVTQLDGHEINQLAHLVEGDVKHIYFIDAYETWWEKGRSYLCRIVDMLHMELVDEVIFGKEVVNRWPEVLDNLIASDAKVSLTSGSK